jgi:hypothetical protein
VRICRRSASSSSSVVEECGGRGRFEDVLLREEAEEVFVGMADEEEDGRRRNWICDAWMDAD